MQVSISGQQLSIGKALQDYVEDRSIAVVKKYFENAIGANVHFTKETFQFVCNIVINEGINKHLIKSDASSDEIYASFDIAIGKVEKQLRKYKEKLKGKNRVRISEVGLSATKYTINPYQTDDEETEFGDNPVIIAEKPIEILSLSASDAVMKMDLENLPALMFKNSKTDRINVVYYRRDGNIAWVDSK